jgi:hypothetical protein
MADLARLTAEALDEREDALRVPGHAAVDQHQAVRDRHQVDVGDPHAVDLVDTVCDLHERHDDARASRMRGRPDVGQVSGAGGP